MSEERIPWWEALTMCWARTKNGERCHRTRRPAYEIEPGNLVIPYTCTLHEDQEDKIRSNG